MSTHWTPLAVPTPSRNYAHIASANSTISLKTDGSPVLQRDKKVYSTSSKAYLPIVPKAFQQG